MGEVSISLSLELDPVGGAISGSLEDAQGKRRSFQGWIEFAVALEAAMDPGRSPQAHSAKTCRSDTGVDGRPERRVKFRVQSQGAPDAKRRGGADDPPDMADEAREAR